MRIVVAVVGKVRQAGLAAAIEDYEKRAARYWPLEVREVREESARSASSDLVRERESERLVATIPTGAQVVACELSGRCMSSPEFASWLQQERERARAVALLIGGVPCGRGSARRGCSGGGRAHAMSLF